MFLNKQHELFAQSSGRFGNYNYMKQIQTKHHSTIQRQVFNSLLASFAPVFFWI